MVLRPFTESDVDLLVELNTDADVMRFLGPPMSRADTEAEFPKYLTDVFLAAFAKDTGEFLGWFEFRPLADGAAELGYRLRSGAWGRGFATEGSRALIDRGFRTGTQRVVAETMFVNSGSRRVMEKCGLRHVRTFHVDWPDPLPGTEHGEVAYELTRDEWLAQHRGQGTGDAPSRGAGI
nr:GNAT family N-acetyltransferase [Lentzea sp. NBRC 105346]